MKKWGPERDIMKNLFALNTVEEITLGTRTPSKVTTSANNLFIGVRVGSSKGANALHLMIAPAVIAAKESVKVGA